MQEPDPTRKRSEVHRPLNVIILHTDQQRYDSLGCCGNPYAVTPNIDRLAREGMLARRHFGANPVCMPSRASLFSGRYCGGHSVVINGIPLPRRDYHPRYKSRSRDWETISHVPTMADVLAEAGYQTCSVGKLHFTPTRSSAAVGMEESVELWKTGKLNEWHGPYYGFDYVEMAIGHGEGLEGHYARWREANFPEIDAAVKSGEHRKNLEFPSVPGLHPSVLTQEAHHSTWVAERAAAYLRERRSADKPFFLFAGFPDPHHPYTPPAELAREFRTRQVAPWHAEAGEIESKPRAMRRLMRQKQYSPDELMRVRQYTDAQVHLIDRSVGRILAALEELNLAANTIVIFTSDHGDYLGDHGLVAKSLMCSAALNHVALIVRHPTAQLPATTDLPVSNADLLPTICQWLGVAAPAGVQGRGIADDLAAGLQGDEGAPVMASGHSPEADEINFALFDARYRYSYIPSTLERELYDHQDDPYELHNRAGDARLADVEQRMHRQLLEMHCRNDQPSIGRINWW